jgi:cell division protein FtsQ
MLGLRKRRRRRSEVRLGGQVVNYETTATRPSFSLTPALKLWQVRGPKITGILVLLLLAWSLYEVFTSTTFFVYGAETRGNVAVSIREIYLASEIDSQSIFWVNPAEVVKNITTLPNIKSASVSLSLPAQVVIEVTERRPELLWQTGDTLWWVDQEGTVVPPKANIDGMMRIIDDDQQPLEVGYKIDPVIIKGAQTLRILVPDVSIVRYSRAQGLIVATMEGWPVYLGDGSQMKAKLMVLSTILPDLRAEETPPLYIDLRNPLRPVYKTVPTIQIEPPAQPATTQPRPVPPLRQPPGQP